MCNQGGGDCRQVLHRNVQLFADVQQDTDMVVTAVWICRLADDDSFRPIVDIADPVP